MTVQRKIKKFLQWPVGKTDQDIQDDIFRRMSAERKIGLWSQFFKLTKDLSGGKIYYGTNRPKTSFDKCR